jgi:hypothetical protein
MISGIGAVQGGFSQRVFFFQSSLVYMTDGLSAMRNYGASGGCGGGFSSLVNSASEFFERAKSDLREREREREGKKGKEGKK